LTQTVDKRMCDTPTASFFFGGGSACWRDRNKSQRPGPEKWRQIIDGQEGSGLTVAAYCLERGITQGSFYAWKQRLCQPAKRNHIPLNRDNEGILRFLNSPDVETITRQLRRGALWTRR
jgi:hypothetical protein